MNLCLANTTLIKVCTSCYEFKTEDEFKCLVDAYLCKKPEERQSYCLVDCSDGRGSDMYFRGSK